MFGKDKKYFVLRETVASDFWQELEDKYIMKSIEKHLHLKKLLWFQHTLGTFIFEYLNKFCKIFADLQNLDVEILDEDNALLNLLPNSYEHLTTTIFCGKSVIRFEVMSNTLINIEYQKLNKKVQEDSSSNALIIRDRSESKNQGG